MGRQLSAPVVATGSGCARIICWLLPVGCRCERLRQNVALQRLGGVEERWMCRVKWFDTNELGPQPADEDSPDRMVIGPPRHRLLGAIPAVRVCLGPDAVAPRLSDGEVADHDLGGSQPQPHQLSWVVEVEHSHIVGQLVDAHRPARAGYLRKLEHRRIPARQVAEGFPGCRFSEPGEVPHVVVRVVDPPAALCVIDRQLVYVA
jgi:hypothetical protein